MSFPATPEKSPEHGLFSSPTRSQSSPIAMQLTPRSKIQALLVDNDECESDKENRDAAGSAKKHISSATKPVSKAAPLSSKKRKSPSPARSEDESLEKTLEVAPKGRMAAKMRAFDEGAQDKETRPVEESAYERVKRQLRAENEAVEKDLESEKNVSGDTLTDFATRSEDHENQLQEESLRRLSPSRHSPVPVETPPPSPSPSPAISPPQPKQTTNLENLFNSPSPERSPVQSRQSTPAKPASAEANDASDGEIPAAPVPNARLQQLLERRRQKLGGSDDVEQEKEVVPVQSQSSSQKSSPPAKTQTKKPRRQVLELDSDGDSDKDAGKRLTEQSRPMRKASKKAQEEMKRETQRLSRNMQLTHEARTKTKFSKQDLFAKFKFRQTNGSVAVAAPQQLQSAPTSSDSEQVVNHETPPSSPPSLTGSATKADTSKVSVAPEVMPSLEATGEIVSMQVTDDEDELPSLEGLLQEAAQRPSESNAKKPTASLPVAPVDDTVSLFSARKFGKSRSKKRSAPDSDDELVIVESIGRGQFAVFDRMPKQNKRESRPLHALRALANLNTHEKPGKHRKKSMNSVELKAMLQQRVRDQALQERTDKIQALAAKGIIVRSAEEQEKEQLQIDDMLERARKEADELAKKEKQAAKKDGNAQHDSEQLPDSDDDEDWDGTDADQEDADENESEDDNLSGSDEEDENEELDSGDGNVASENNLVDEIAAEGASDESEGSGAEESEEEGTQVTDDEDSSAAAKMPPPPRPSKRNRRVLSDDDEDDEEPVSKSVEPSVNSTTPAKSKADAFGFSEKDSPQIGLSQVFVGTMADTQTQPTRNTFLSEKVTPKKDAFGFRGNTVAMGLSQVFQATMGDSPVPKTPGSHLRERPAPFPDFSPDLRRDQPSENYIVGDSQKNDQMEQSQNSPIVVQSPQIGISASQASDVPEPTQDHGFALYSQASLQASYSTVATEPIEVGGSIEEQAPTRKGRLAQRQAIVESSGEEEGNEDEAQSSKKKHFKDTLLSSSAFDVMQKSSKAVKKRDEYNRMKSAAKGMVEEQAEESEDEYAGLGGASDDESGDEVDEETKRLIDDASNEKVNERELAALYAERQMADDEKHMQRLFTDVVGGGLRRKRGGEMDLFEFDDEDEAAERRRAAKQRHEAKMRRALLADEKIGKIAENPKQAAFLQAIADRDEEDDVAFLDLPEDPSQSDATSSQYASPQDAAGDSQTHHGDGDIFANKHHNSDTQDFAARGKENNTATNSRRSAKVTKPTSLAEIRNTLSEIVGMPNSVAETQFEEYEETEFSYETGEGDDNFTFSGRFHASSRRTETTAEQQSVIDRMALKRANSTNAARKGSTRDRLAFNTSFKASNASFKAPSLLRRATTNSSIASESSTSDKASAAGLSKAKEAVKMGGSKKSSVNYYVREQEKKARLDEIEKKRNDERVRVGKKRGNGRALGALAGGGQFA